jgi:hypothetical protein
MRAETQGSRVKRSILTKTGIRGGLICLWLHKENKKLRDWTNLPTLHIPPWRPHTYDFVVLTSLTHSRKILLVLLQIVNRISQRLISSPTYRCQISIKTLPDTKFYKNHSNGTRVVTLRNDRQRDMTLLISEFSQLFVASTPNAWRKHTRFASGDWWCLFMWRRGVTKCSYNLTLTVAVKKHWSNANTWVSKRRKRLAPAPMQRTDGLQRSY